MNRHCTNCNLDFQIPNEQLSFLEKVSPSFGEKLYTIPPPTHCPRCREQRRLSFRNERNLYHRHCASTEKQIISAYSADKPLVVYEQPLWWSDSWDALDYGREFDFNRRFFEQFVELRSVVPRMTFLQSQNENSQYTNCVSHLKDCYLMFSSDFNRDCLYGTWAQNCRDCLDALYLHASELAYQSVFSQRLYQSKYIVLSSQCSDSSFLFDCKGCSDCFMCFGLRNKSHCIENVQYSKEDYQKKLSDIWLGSYRTLQRYCQRFSEMCERAPHFYLWRRGRILDSSGDFLVDVENCRDCYETTSAKDCCYVQCAFEIKDTWDTCYAMGELGYENSECFPQPFQSAFNLNSYTGSNLYYCDMCMNSCSHLFGCIGLKHQQYCILNRAFSKQDFEALVPRIIEHMEKTGEWGEFFPTSISPYGYNETNAIEEFPLSKREALSKGYSWKDPDEKDYQAASFEVPDDIRDVTESIASEILACSACNKNYKIISQELSFYKNMGLAVPRHCPECRHLQRNSFRNRRLLHQRHCNQCSAELQSTYSSNSPEEILCEHCYLGQLDSI